MLNVSLMATRIYIQRNFARKIVCAVSRPQ
ncbi:MAG: hypothetical protein JWQ90_4342 [Hydrocarboniphaga sp.]|nr:hypothetical protein [Hydrocarboniphaga sp.]